MDRWNLCTHVWTPERVSNARIQLISFSAEDKITSSGGKVSGCRWTDGADTVSFAILLTL